MEQKEEVISKAIQVLNSSGIVIYPTDTAFGIGCRIDRPKSVDRLLAFRKRPLSQAMPVLVATKEMALPYWSHPSHIVRCLMNQYWPGSLTIVAPCKKRLIYPPIRGGRDTVGLRMPNYKTILTIIEGVGVPILGPSANFHGKPTPYRLQDLDPELVKLVDLVVPGKCSVGQASTVVDCSVDPYKIIRQGAVKLPEGSRPLAALFIDTSVSDTAEVALEIEGKRFTRTFKSHTMKAQMALPLIEKLLKAHHLNFSAIDQIKVNTGPGSFMGLRVGLALANALGMLLGIPVNGTSSIKELDSWYPKAKFN